MDLEKQSKQMAQDILKSLGQEKNPVGIMLDMYIKRQLEKLENEIKQNVNF